MWPFERPLSYIRALAHVPEHAEKVRAATETGDFLKAWEHHRLNMIEHEEFQRPML